VKRNDRLAAEIRVRAKGEGDGADLVKLFASKSSRRAGADDDRRSDSGRLREAKASASSWSACAQPLVGSRRNACGCTTVHARSQVTERVEADAAARTYFGRTSVCVAELLENKSASGHGNFNDEGSPSRRRHPDEAQMFKPCADRSGLSC